MDSKSLSKLLLRVDHILLEHHGSRDPAVVSALRKEIEGCLERLDETRASLMSQTRHHRARSVEAPFLLGTSRHKKPLQVVVETMIALKSHLNLLAPISRLPTEILHYIFSLRVRHCLDSFRMSIMSVTRSPINTLAWIAVTHVCRRWRETVINDPNLWTQVSPSESSWATEMLLRSHHQPLFVKADLFDLHSDGVDAAILVLQELSRIRELTLVIPNANVVGAKLIQPAPILHSFAVRVFRPFTSPSLQEPFLAGTAPCLRRLSLENCQIPRDSPFLNQLTHLRLADSQLMLDMAQFLAILRDLDNLMELFITNITLMAPLSEVQVEIMVPVTLPRLVTLTVTDFPTIFLRKLHLPSSPDMHLAFSLRRVSTSEGLSFMISSILRYFTEATAPTRSLAIEKMQSFLRIGRLQDHVSGANRCLNVRFTNTLFPMVSRIVAAFLAHPPIGDYLHVLDVRGPDLRIVKQGSARLKELRTIIFDQESAIEWLASIVKPEVLDIYPRLQTIAFASPVFSLQWYGSRALAQLVTYLTSRIQTHSRIETLKLSELDYSESVTAQLQGLVPQILCY
ncbi:hypothetical protein FPV67DRAFT_395858 [Lyophyllum atratum]|nr:hypothetical protein FPV67DRAFT_395858 [Lyophyllum atratum]